MKRATAQATKNKLISDLRQARQAILDVARSLPAEKQNEVFLGVWSTVDMLAHLAGWDFTNLAAAKDILADRIPEFYGYYDHDWRSYNARLVEEYKKDNLGEMVSSVESSHRRLVDFIETVPAEEFNRDRGLRVKGYKVTIARLLQAELDDEKIHHQQIQDFAQSGH